VLTLKNPIEKENIMDRTDTAFSNNSDKFNVDRIGGIEELDLSDRCMTTEPDAGGAESVEELVGTGEEVLEEADVVIEEIIKEPGVGYEETIEEPGVGNAEELHVADAESVQEPNVALAGATGSVPAIYVPVAPVDFDYSELEPEVVEEARAAAGRIRKRIQAAKLGMLEVGRELLNMKEKLKHGAFGKWIRAEFDMTDRTAQNYMSVARELSGNPEIVSYFPPTTTYRLVAKSVPSDVRKAIIDGFEAGSIRTADEVELRLSEVRKAKKNAREEARRNAGKSPEEIANRTKREDADARRIEREREGAQRMDELRRRAATKYAESIKKKLGLRFSKFRVALEGIDLNAFLAAVRKLDSAEPGEASGKAAA
jgi:hypothetical protein